MSNDRNASITLNINAIIKIGLSNGIVIYTVSWNRLAPSILAASYVSTGIICSPAYKIIIIKGVHCHVSIIIIVISAVVISVAQPRGGIPTNPRR